MRFHIGTADVGARVVSGDGALAPGYAGIRPKTSGPGEPASDFEIQGPLKHGVRGLVQLYGIESPGLTASLALARRVREALG